MKQSSYQQLLPQHTGVCKSIPDFSAITEQQTVKMLETVTQVLAHIEASGKSHP